MKLSLQRKFNKIHMLIIADQSIPYLKGILEPYAEVQYLPSTGFTPDNIRNAEVLVVRSIDKCSRELLENSKVRLITTATIGYDHIDTHYCDKAGIIWKNAPGCNAVSVAQYIFSTLLSLSFKNRISLKEKTIGIIGVGHVGKEVEKLCRGYGMNILLNDPPRAEKEDPHSFVSLEQIAAEADIVTFHTPLTKEGCFPTYHLADNSFFQKCKRIPWFINASRGGVHDTKALIEAKEKGILGELIIDCWENEPDINRTLLAYTSIATPHIAGFSADGKANATRMCVEYINNFYKLNISGIQSIAPEPLKNSWIELNVYPDHRIENAFLATFNSLPVDKALKEAPEKFEWFRSHYAHPREPKAYTLLDATKEEKEIGKKLGFGISL